MNYTVATKTETQCKPSATTQNRPQSSKTIHTKTSGIILNEPSPLETTNN